MDNNKPNKHKNSFLKFLPKAASAVSFQNPPFSPGRDRHHHGNHHAYKGFSGPINFAVLPDEAREKPKNGSAYESHEPTSPKISCMGQIKCKHHKKTKKPKKADNVSSTTTINDNNNNNNTKSSPSSMMRKFFGTKKKSASKGKGGTTRDDACDRDQIIKERTKTMPPASGLGQLRKFASGRETLKNFDWTAHQIAPIDHDRDCYSDEERRRKRDDDDEDDDEDEDVKEVIIPFSAPMMLGGGSYSNLGLKPRKEVNLWKRRTMDPPPPLALKSK